MVGSLEAEVDAGKTRLRIGASMYERMVQENRASCTQEMQANYRRNQGRQPEAGQGPMRRGEGLAPRIEASAPWRGGRAGCLRRRRCRFPVPGRCYRSEAKSARRR